MTPLESGPLPGTRLRAIARLFFDDETMTRVVDPALADMQHEVADATDARAAQAARLHGTIAFWKLVLMSPFAFNDWPGRRQSLRSFILAGILLTLIVVAASTESAWMTRVLSRVFPPLLTPIISVADVGPYVWLLTPTLITLLALIGRQSPFRVAPATVLLVGCATAVAAAAYGAAGFVAIFDRVGRSGSAGPNTLTGAADALALPTLLALGVAFLAAAVAAVSQWRLHRDWAGVAVKAGQTSGVNGLLTCAVLVTSMVVAHYWLTLNLALLEVVVFPLNAARAAAAGQTGASIAARSELAIPVVLLGSILSVAMLIAAAGVWRGARAGWPPRVVTWATRLAVVVALIGCVWHGAAISRTWNVIQTEAKAALARR